jgi:hypothetical protein
MKPPICISGLEVFLCMILSGVKFYLNNLLIMNKIFGSSAGRIFHSGCLFENLNRFILSNFILT